jgi:hypothetical protein
MRSPHFARGLDDIRAGRPFTEPATADLSWSATANASWEYERGRLFGAIAPLSMPIFIDGCLNPKAVRLCALAFERGLIP